MCGPACYPGMTRKIVIPAVLGDDSKDSDYAPYEGMYYNAVVEYKANGAVYIFSGDGIYTRLRDGDTKKAN